MRQRRARRAITSPSAFSAVKATDRAIRVAGEPKNDAMVRGIEATRAPLAEHLVSMSVRLPERKASRKRKARVA